LTRTGVEPGQSAFSKVGEAWRSGQLDGDVYAEPLVARGQVVVATENDSVYTFDLSTGHPGWQVHLGEPVPRSQLPCGDIDPTGARPWRRPSLTATRSSAFRRTCTFSTGSPLPTGLP